MKNILTVVFVTIFLFSCSTGKKIITAEEVNTATQPIVEITQDSVVFNKVPIDSTITSPTIDEIPTKKIETSQHTTINPEVFNHVAWDMLLKANVSPMGNVNYEGFRQAKGQLRDYIASLGAQMPLNSWTQEDKLAYWMNAYNAMTIDLIVRNLPLNSIKEIDKPWEQRLWKLGTKWYNLDEIEHQILRKMNDPRIHFGINCASFSCPPLLNAAFTSSKVEGQLDFLAKQFVNDASRNTITPNKVELSKIFNWFAKDFKQEGSIIDFLNKYTNTSIDKNARKSFKTYNWDLNI